MRLKTAMNEKTERFAGIVFVSVCVTGVCLAGYTLASTSASLLTIAGLGLGMMLFFWIGYSFSPQYESSHDTIQIKLNDDGGDTQ